MRINSLLDHCARKAWADTATADPSTQTSSAKLLLEVASGIEL